MVSVSSTSSSLFSSRASSRVAVCFLLSKTNNMDAVVRPPVRWRFSAFDPLSFVAFPDYPHDLPARKWLKRIPLFAGRLGESVKDHLDKFLQVVWEFNVEHEDVVMRMFVSTLEWEARAWYKSLPDASIDGWDSFQEKFTERWANTHDIFFLCTVFSIIKKHESETVCQFNARFFKFYNRIPYRVRPNEDVALIYYLEAFDGIFGVFLRNEDPQNLEEAQAAAIKLERNHLAACELPPIHVPDQPVKVTPLDDLQPLVVTEVQEVCVIEDEPQLAPCQVPKDEQEGDSPILDDPTNSCTN
jgi:hypothetical protein